MSAERIIDGIRYEEIDSGDAYTFDPPSRFRFVRLREIAEPIEIIEERRRFAQALTREVATWR